MHAAEPLSALLLGVLIAAVASVMATLLGKSLHRLLHSAVAVCIGLLSAAFLATLPEISLPYLWVLGHVAAVTALPLVVVHICRINTQMLRAGAIGALVSVGLLASILAHLNQSLMQVYAILGWVVAAAAGYTAASLAAHLLAFLSAVAAKIHARSNRGGA